MSEQHERLRNNQYSLESSQLNGPKMPTSQEMTEHFNMARSCVLSPEGVSQAIPNITIPPEFIQQSGPNTGSSSSKEAASDTQGSQVPYLVFPHLPVNVRGVSEPVLRGQPIEGREVFWQFDNQQKLHCFWQEFDGDAAIFWNVSDQSLVYSCRKKNGELVDLNGAIFGRDDNLLMWIARYRQLTILETLLRNEFSSIKPQEMFSLITLVSHADSLGVVNGITIRQLSDLTGYSKDTTLRHIERLKRSKMIKEISKLSKLKKKGQLQEKQLRSYKILLGSELAELDGVLFKQLEDRMS